MGISESSTVEEAPKSTPQGSGADLIPALQSKDMLYKTDILKDYPNARMEFTPLFESTGTRVYKILDPPNKIMLLHVATVSVAEDGDRFLADRCFFKLLGEEHPNFAKVVSVMSVVMDAIRSGDPRVRYVESLVLCEGRQLEELIPSATDQQVKSWVLQSLEALRYARARGAPQFDVTPRNVLVDPEGRLRIVSFGSFVAADSALKAVFRTNSLETGPADYIRLYTAPEALLGAPHADLDPRSPSALALYSWATCFFQTIARLDRGGLLALKQKYPFARTEGEYAGFLFDGVQSNDKLRWFDKTTGQLIAAMLQFRPESRVQFFDQLCGQAVAALEPEGYAAPELAAEANYYLGNAYYRGLGQYEVALGYLQKAINVQKRLKLHSDLEWTYMAMGNLQAAMGNFSDALRFYLKAKGLSRAPADEDKFNARYYNDAGNVQSCTYGNQDEAVLALQKASSFQLKVSGGASKEVADTFSNLGNAFANAKRFVEARQKHKEALDMRKDILGPEHIDVAASYCNLANVLDSTGDHKGALDMYESALMIQRKLLGETHPLTALTYNNKGAALANVGDLAAARELYEKAMRIWANVLPKGHRWIKMGEENLANLGKVGPDGVGCEGRRDAGR